MNGRGRLRHATERCDSCSRRVMRPADGVSLRDLGALRELLFVFRAFLIRRVEFRFVVGCVRRGGRIGVAGARGPRGLLQRRHLRAASRPRRRRRLADGLRVVEHQPARAPPLHLAQHQLTRVPVHSSIVHHSSLVVFVGGRRGPLNLHRVRDAVVQRASIKLEVLVVGSVALLLLRFAPSLVVVVGRDFLLPE